MAEGDFKDDSLNFKGLLLEINVCSYLCEPESSEEDLKCIEEKEEEEEEAAAAVTAGRQDRPIRFGFAEE